MSQISSRLSDSKLGSLGAWGTPRTVASDATPHLRANGRSYMRRLICTDLMIITASLALPLWQQIDAAGGLQIASEKAIQMSVWGVFLTIAWMIVLKSFNTHSIGSVAVGLQEYRLLGLSGLALAGLLGIYIGLSGQNELRIFLLYSVPMATAGLMLSRWSWRQWLIWRSRDGYALSNVLIYGQPADIPYAIRQISRSSSAAYRVVGAVIDGPQNQMAENEIHAVHPSLPLAYSLNAVETEANRLSADSVLVVGPLSGGTEALQNLGWKLESTGTSLMVASSLTGIADRRVRTSPVDGMPLMVVQPAKFTGARYLVKRSFDIVFSSLALLGLLPVFAAIALLIRLDGPGKIFFRQERAGQDGRPFKMFKFRTMVNDAEARLAELQEANEGSGPLFKLKDDPRITRCGRWLRKHSLDELPQFLNVLLGDMSVVGPRPPLFSEVDTYEGNTHRRLLLKPGVTGLWQVSGRSNLDWDESVRLDLYYAENWTLLTDLRLIWRTFRVMIKPDGAY